MKYKSQDVESVHLADMPKADESIDWKKDQMRWSKITALRDEVLRVLEGLRQEKKIASNQQASVTINCSDENLLPVLNDFGLEQFAALCIASEVKLERTDGQTTVTAQKSSHRKCQRCWNYWPSVGSDEKYSDLCKRCVDVVSNS